MTRYFGNGAGGVRLEQLGPEHRDRRLGAGAVGGARSTSRPRATPPGCRRRRRYGAVYDVLQTAVAAPLEANLETHGHRRAPTRRSGRCTTPGKHYAFTTMAAARGFCDMAAMAEQGGQGRRRHALRDAVGEGEARPSVGASSIRRWRSAARSRGSSAQQVLRRRGGRGVHLEPPRRLRRADREGDARRCSTTCASTRAASSATTTG